MFLRGVSSPSLLSKEQLELLLWFVSTRLTGMDFWPLSIQHFIPLLVPAQR